MRAMVLGALVGAGLVMAAVGSFDPSGEALAQRPVSYQQAGPGSDLIALSNPVGESGQLVTVIDPGQRVMSVYHIDSVSGKIALRSVRNIHWDLQMSYLNCEKPLPQEIRAMLEQR